MAEIRSPISGGIRAVRSTVSSNILSGGVRPQQQQQQQQGVDGATARLISRNSLLLNSVVSQLGNVTQQVVGLRRSLDLLKENLEVESRLEKLREQAKAARDIKEAEQALREGAENTIEKKIQLNLIRPFSKIASKTQLTLARLGAFFKTLFFGWLVDKGVKALGALSEDNRDKFNKIIGDVGKILLVLGGIFIASKVGVGKLLASIISFNFKLIRFNAVNLLLAPFRMIGNIIRAILVRAARFAPWLLPTLSALGGGEVEGQGGDTNLGDIPGTGTDNSGEIEVPEKNDGGVITAENNTLEGIKAQDQKLNVLREEDTGEDDDKKGFFKTAGDYWNWLMLGIPRPGTEEDITPDPNNQREIDPKDYVEEEGSTSGDGKQIILPNIPDKGEFTGDFDFGFNNKGSGLSEDNLVQPDNKIINDKKGKLEIYNQEDDNSPIIVPMPIDQSSGGSDSGGSITGGESGRIPGIAAVNSSNIYMYSSYKVFQITPTMAY